MKNFILIFFLFVANLAFSQTYVSVDNKKEAWETNSTWIKSPNQSWVPDNPGNNLNWTSLTILGTVTRNSNLTVQGSTPIYITDTLIVKGSLNMNAGSKIIVQNGGVLIVVGDINMTGGMSITSTGTGRIVNTGQFTMSNGTITIDNQFYNFDTTPTFSGGPTINGTQYTSFPPPNGNSATLAAYLSSKNDLKTQDPSLYAYVMGFLPAMPIELISFIVDISDSKPVLTWVTALEKDNDYFTVLRSDDGKNFTDVGTVTGAGNSKTEIKYEWTDNSDLSGVQYYMIKQTDFDGKSESFKVVSVTLNWTLIEGYRINDDEKVISVTYYDLSGRIVDRNHEGIKILNILTNKKLYTHKVI